mmetsp:Transcript_13467/g.33621  ORF Transcript_13467/g.33621 Transcript_13467/m.33621 type:complete len:224 (-) Transcript_13467:173-844(-)
MNFLCVLGSGALGCAPSPSSCGRGTYSIGSAAPLPLMPCPSTHSYPRRYALPNSSTGMLAYALGAASSARVLTSRRYRSSSLTKMEAPPPMRTSSSSAAAAAASLTAAASSFASPSSFTFGSSIASPSSFTSSFTSLSFTSPPFTSASSFILPSSPFAAADPPPSAPRRCCAPPKWNVLRCAAITLGASLGRSSCPSTISPTNSTFASSSSSAPSARMLFAEA